MNVYQQTHTEEFIKNLPVDFYKIKNMDLSKIQPVYHDLFTTDWNWGAHSKMKYGLRVVMNDLFKEYNNQEICEEYDNKNKKVEKKEEILLGGFED